MRQRRGQGTDGRGGGHVRVSGSTCASAAGAASSSSRAAAAMSAKAAQGARGGGLRRGHGKLQAAEALRAAPRCAAGACVLCAEQRRARGAASARAVRAQPSSQPRAALTCEAAAAAQELRTVPRCLSSARPRGNTASGGSESGLMRPGLPQGTQKSHTTFTLCDKGAHFLPARRRAHCATDTTFASSSRHEGHGGAVDGCAARSVARSALGAHAC